MLPEVIVGTNVRVNRDPGTASRPQVEPSVASNPTNPLELVAGFADTLNGPVAFDFAPGVSRSADGGQTWSVPTGGPRLPNPPGFIWGSRTLATHLAAGDSAVAWGPGETVYFSTLGFHDNQVPPNNDCSSGGIYVYRSNDAGNAWTLPAGGPAVSNTQTTFADKEYIAVDVDPLSPFAGRIYLVWDHDVYTGCPQDFSANFHHREIRFSGSSDGGASWSSPVVLATGCLIAPVPAVGSNGDLYVVWHDCNAGIRHLVRKSTNGGVTFGPAVAAASGLTNPPNPLSGSSFRVNATFPVIATDPTDANKVYVTWSSDNGPSHTDVFVSRSLDGGATWSATPTRVNDDPPGNPRDQFFPWISVGADGTVRVMWGDDRLDLVNPGGKLYDIFIAESTDHGASFGPNVRVTTMSSNPDFDGFGGTFIGDYFGLSSSGIPVWGDTRNGNQDIFSAPVSFTGFSIAGQVTRGATGLAGVTMTLSGPASMTVATDSGGNYLFGGLGNGSYTLTPSRPGCTFTPTQRFPTIAGSNLTGRSFAATCGFSIFDGFTGATINPNLWHGEELSDPGTSDTETSRGIQNGQLRMSLTTFGKTDSDTANLFGGQTRLQLNHPAGLSVLFVQATVTQAVAQGCVTNPTATKAGALLSGAFFNDGSSGGLNDRTGDVIARIQMVWDSNLGPGFELEAIRCDDAACTTSTPLGISPFTKSWALNQKHPLVLAWDVANKQFLGIVDFQTATQETQTVSYGALSDTSAPGLDFKDLGIRHFVASCTAGATMAQMTVLFDNFFAQ
jgi:hypothetical protein